MADNRMYLRCRSCQAEFRLATYNQPGPWDASPFETGDLSKWFAEHGLPDGRNADHEGRDYDWTPLDSYTGRWYEIAYE
jgi:hypothetical protein